MILGEVSSREYFHLFLSKMTVGRALVVKHGSMHWIRGEDSQRNTMVVAQSEYQDVPAQGRGEMVDARKLRRCDRMEEQVAKLV